MARDKLTEYSATASENTVCGDVNIAENSALPSDLNNYAREIMTHLKEFADGTNGINVLSLADDDASAAIKFQAPSAVTATVTFTLPDGDGESGQTLVTNGSGTLAWHAPYGNRNLLINGQFQMWQRGTSITSNNSNKYTADRWHSGANGSEDVVYSRQFTNTSDGTPYMRVRRTGTASGRMYLTQMMETSVLDFCRGKTVTLSFKARKHADFDATFVSRIATQTNQTPRDDNVVQNSDVTRTLTTSFQTFTQSLTLTSSSDSANGFRVEFVVEDGANSSSNYYYEVRDVQLEIGSVATPIEHRSFADELARCQRYYYVVAEGLAATIPTGSYYSSTLVATTVIFPTEMRATPALKNPSVTDGYSIYASNTEDTFDQINSIARNTKRGASLDITSGVSGTVGHSGPMRTRNASSFLAFDAEL